MLHKIGTVCFVSKIKLLSFLVVTKMRDGIRSTLLYRALDYDAF